MAGPDTSEDRERFVREAFTETMEADGVPAVAEFFAPDLAYYRSAGDLAGFENLERDVEMFRTAFPDMEATIGRLVAGEDRVSFLYTLTGTHQGEFDGIPPTNREVDAKGAAIARIENGLIAEYRIVFDNLGMLEQLGVLGE